jgi:CubicO group peptidase (beta-lactamase class C family)
MKKGNSFILSFLLIAGSAACAMAQASRSTYNVNGKTINIDTLNKQILHIMEDVGVPGLSVAVIDHGERVFYNTYGYKDLSAGEKEKIDKETIFEACSLSKSFTVYAAYLLLNDGKLDLDKPLYQYLEYEPLKHDERYKLITARMVLNHSSGIENHVDNNKKDVLEIMSPPGTTFIYSGEGYIYLSKVIEKITNAPVIQYMQDSVYNPLNLKRSYTICTDEANRNYAVGHDAFGKPIYKERNRIPDLAGRIHTNAGDYATLMLGLFDEKHIRREKINEIFHKLTKEPMTSNTSYGAGYEVFFLPDGDTILLQGGDNNGFKGMACYSLKNKCGLVFFANANRAERIGSKLCEIATGLNISSYYEGIYNNIYPSAANTLFHIYKEKGAEELRKEFDRYLENEQESRFKENDMVELVYYLKDKEYQTAKYIAESFRKKHPVTEANFVFERFLNK